MRGADGPAAGRHDFREPGEPDSRGDQSAGLFPYPSLPHPLQTNGGQVFPQVQTAMFPRLERFDVEFDLPNEFLPEFPPAIFLQNRPELGDVSRGQVVSLTNFRAVQGDHDAGPTGGNAPPIDTTARGGIQSHRRSEESAAPARGGVSGLPHQRPHYRAIPPQPGHPTARTAIPDRHYQSAGPVQPADPRIEEEFAVGRGLHRVRASEQPISMGTRSGRRRRDSRSCRGAPSLTWPRHRTCSTSRRLRN